MADTWEPSTSAGIPRETPLSTEPGTTGLPWVSAPATSHVHSFRFYDARKYSFLRKFGPDWARGKSQLHVRFRGKTGGAGSEYVYYFSDHDEGASYYAAFVATNHPGEVVEQLKAAGVSYQKQGLFG